MLLPIALGCALLVLNLGIQIWAVGLVVRYLRRHIVAPGHEYRILGPVMMFLLLGHLLQFATWALLFRLIGEFADFETALYHSIVNFTSLGYGDIVMSPSWRMLGALEAANGVMMFGLTGGLLFSVFSVMLRRRQDVDELLRHPDEDSVD